MFLYRKKQLKSSWTGTPRDMPEDLEPKLTEDWVRVQYWECNVLGHRHKSRRAASSCIMKRKGESGELKKLKRNLSMVYALQKGEAISNIAAEHHCTSPNVIKAVNSSLQKAWNFANQNGGIPYKNRSWRVSDFTEEEYAREMNFLLGILQEMEVKLEKLVK